MQINQLVNQLIEKNQLTQLVRVCETLAKINQILGPSGAFFIRSQDITLGAPCLVLTAENVLSVAKLFLKNPQDKIRYLLQLYQQGNLNGFKALLLENENLTSQLSSHELFAKLKDQQGFEFLLSLIKMEKFLINSDFINYKIELKKLMQQPIEFCKYLDEIISGAKDNPYSLSQWQELMKTLDKEYSAVIIKLIDIKKLADYQSQISASTWLSPAQRKMIQEKAVKVASHLNCSLQTWNEDEHLNLNRFFKLAKDDRSDEANNLTVAAHQSLDARGSDYLYYLANPKQLCSELTSSQINLAKDYFKQECSDNFAFHTVSLPEIDFAAPALLSVNEKVTQVLQNGTDGEKVSLTDTLNMISKTVHDQKQIRADWLNYSHTQEYLDYLLKTDLQHWQFVIANISRGYLLYGYQDELSFDFYTYLMPHYQQIGDVIKDLRRSVIHSRSHREQVIRLKLNPLIMENSLLPGSKNFFELSDLVVAAEVNNMEIFLFLWELCEKFLPQIACDAKADCKNYDPEWNSKNDRVYKETLLRNMKQAVYNTFINKLIALEALEYLKVVINHDLFNMVCNSFELRRAQFQHVELKEYWYLKGYYRNSLHVVHSPLVCALFMDKIQIFDYLMQQKSVTLQLDSDVYKDLITIAVVKENPQLLKRFLVLTAEVKVSLYDALELSFRRRVELSELMLLLLETKKVNLNDDTIINAVMRNQPLAELFLSYVIHHNLINQETAKLFVRCAIIYGNQVLLQKLFDSKLVSINDVIDGQDQLVPLMYAKRYVQQSASVFNLKIFKFLLTQPGIDLSCLAKDGDSIIDFYMPHYLTKFDRYSSDMELIPLIPYLIELDLNYRLPVSNETLQRLDNLCLSLDVCDENYNHCYYARENYNPEIPAKFEKRERDLKPKILAVRDLVYMHVIKKTLLKESTAVELLFKDPLQLQNKLPAFVKANDVRITAEMRQSAFGIQALAAMINLIVNNSRLGFEFRIRWMLEEQVSKCPSIFTAYLQKIVKLEHGNPFTYPQWMMLIRLLQEIVNQNSQKKFDMLMMYDYKHPDHPEPPVSLLSEVNAHRVVSFFSAPPKTPISAASSSSSTSATLNNTAIAKVIGCANQVLEELQDKEHFSDEERTVIKTLFAPIESDKEKFREQQKNHNDAREILIKKKSEMILKYLTATGHFAKGDIQLGQEEQALKLFNEKVFAGLTVKVVEVQAPVVAQAAVSSSSTPAQLLAESSSIFISLPSAPTHELESAPAKKTEEKVAPRDFIRA